jgi:LCP family protein required for cell wall assembly
MAVRERDGSASGGRGAYRGAQSSVYRAGGRGDDRHDSRRYADDHGANGRYGRDNGFDDHDGVGGDFFHEDNWADDRHSSDRRGKAGKGGGKGGSDRRRPSSGQRYSQDPPRSSGNGRRPKRPKRPKSPLWARLLLVFGSVMVFLSGGSIVAFQLVLNDLNNSINHDKLLGGAAGSGKSGKAIDGAINVLMLGIDDRDNGDGARADSIIILHIPATHDQAYMISIPRDTMVSIPAYPKTKFAGMTRSKINAAYLFGSQNGGGRAGGFDLLAQTVKDLTGVGFDGGAIVNFGGFQQLVNALGGVDMCVDEKVVSIHIGVGRDGKFLAPDKGGKPVTYLPGCQHMAPWQALDYVRQRENLPNGDYDRERHQQQFLKAVLKEAVKQGVTSNPIKLRSIMNAAGKAFTVDLGDSGLEDWIFTLSGIGDKDLVILKTNAGQVNTVVVNGEDFEQLTPASQDMFVALQQDKLADFVIAHPEFVATDGSLAVGGPTGGSTP